MSLETPLSRVRGLGSAGAGTNHFWWQRVTAVANVVLVLFLAAFMFRYAGADFQTVRQALRNPIASIGLLLLVVSGVWHMRLGMQTIIEDYVHREGRRVAALMLNTFFAAVIALTCAYAVLKLSFGA